jgi:hypothetical protein
VRAVVGASLAGTVFACQSLAALKEGIDASEIDRFGAKSKRPSSLE